MEWITYKSFVMKYILLSLICCSALIVKAQTMQWIPMKQGLAGNACPVQKSKKQQLLCYALEYTPATSGVLTSYTTAFFVTCSSLGSPVAINRSCSMTDNGNVINGCEENGVILLNSSGNSGNAGNNTVQAGLPVILHQVCFFIPTGESIVLTEDPVTDLTTSIDMVTEDIVTEYPSFTEFTVQNKKYDVSKPSLLDFKGVAVGDFVAQLDWSVAEDADVSVFEIERAAGNDGFKVIGRVEALEPTGKFVPYTFLDKAALSGNNFYRLKITESNGDIKSSPVRMVIFNDTGFKVSFTPNPADDILNVLIQSPGSKSVIKLVDPAGRVVIEESFEEKSINAHLEVGSFNAGLYTLVVENGTEKFSEKIMIAH